MKVEQKATVAKILAINSLLALALFEFVSAFFLKEVIRRVNEDYLIFGPSRVSLRVKEAKKFQPKPYYEPHEIRGFDIAPGVSSGVQKVGDKTGGFPIWSNSLGCFDMPENGKRFKIYLAGDSYTWGFSEHKNLFGSILEDEMKAPIASCGVSHTGTLHQFQKFKEIARQISYFPDIVIVNVYHNDIENDFLHPHTTIVNGVQVDIASVGEYGKEEEPFADRLSQEQVMKKQNIALGLMPANSVLHNFSATLSLAMSLLKEGKFFWNEAILKRPSQCRHGYIYASRKCFNRLKGLAKKHYPLMEPFGAPHRHAIASWISHSRQNGYRIIFSFIDFRLNVQSRERFCKFVKSLDAECWSFGSYLDERGIHRDTVRWPDNEHFNALGHRLYAEHIKRNLLPIDD